MTNQVYRLERNRNSTTKMKKNYQEAYRSLIKLTPAIHENSLKVQ